MQPTKYCNIGGLVHTTVAVEYIPHQLDMLVFESKEPISVRRALELPRDASRGVAQLHDAPKAPFAHTDLQVRQFLVDTDGTWKLNDFNRVKDAGLRLVDGVPSGEKLADEIERILASYRDSR
ncbi:unnamed protein product [Peronospora farinosa]|uniref:Protein kinase domain-containing protein n=1 Tax=Peronospora farinosa TaxID=134698 RepID=A0ABN8C7J9_9STRA|nr:unnamed protein product [Peronospora farinosa]